MLQVDVQGCGPNLVMLHGWGMHSAVWSDWAATLAGDFCIHCVDLPGHGNSSLVADDTLEAWAAEIMQVVPEGAWWVGWSLGGLLAQQAACLSPQTVRGLVLIASTPCFVKTDDWPHGVDSAIFDRFAQQLDENAERTLGRFLALQVRGAQGSAETLQHLRAKLQQRPLAQAAALRFGLALLSGSDLRALNASLQMPVHWLLGERDTLVPGSVATDCDGHYQVITGAGHAPFLSHPGACTACLQDWLLTDRDRQHAAG